MTVEALQNYHFKRKRFSNIKANSEFLCPYQSQSCLIAEKQGKSLPRPQESRAQGGDFLIVAQSDFCNSIGLYCEPISHSYCYTKMNKNQYENIYTQISHMYKQLKPVNSHMK